MSECRVIAGGAAHEGKQVMPELDAATEAVR